MGSQSACRLTRATITEHHALASIRACDAPGEMLEGRFWGPGDLGPRWA